MGEVAQFFLWFTNYFLAIFFVWGLIFGKRQLFFQAAVLLFLGTLWNFALKVTFKVPLDPRIGKVGFAFPSGHMQAAVVVYGWLSLKSGNWIYKILVIFLLIAIACSMVFFDYHTYADSLAAIVSGGILMLYFQSIREHWEKNIQLIVLGVTGTVFLMYGQVTYGVEPYVLQAYGMLSALLIFSKLAPFFKRYS